ncbi:glucose-1-phosphate cytidylyltransferase [Methylobacterium sp. Leaf399]|uniref:glucose-1-phosphate cytidylyltransferase n=1 Tax=unclassified Methylobacterium TaxID=2615210 RepID=UPI0006FC1D62|nr:MULTISPECIES: glucose-1-phosphate cytidylyltransferase [unclassified Methylobacterium]KQP61700.1 glucose-1-phosphate cytidylyltransferase [Methylobacterium sp. Leaf108]KQT19978.1 glucose-1-phosphate cytidylyltransferase [Methylobacterium sp. Leaf399]KQT78496.1 glucose-1-phosphate cytidylyltransferase [Methylobacterium sp. Leaf466]
MKAVILAGGLGTRLSEETVVRPKPMVEIGGRPILWHIMQIFAAHGTTDFVICLGYKGYMIKEFFLNYRLHLSDVTIDIGRGKIDFHRSKAENWRISLIETGPETMTGGRLKRVRDYLGDEDFFMTYGDGVSDVDLTALAAYHRERGRLATLTAVLPPGRFGALELDRGGVRRFREKPVGDGVAINGGFFVLSPKVIDLIEGDTTVWEKGPLETLAREDQLSAYVHDGFWHAMDTLRDKNHLEALWTQGAAPWKLW